MHSIIVYIAPLGPSKIITCWSESTLDATVQNACRMRVDCVQIVASVCGLVSFLALPNVKPMTFGNAYTSAQNFNRSSGDMYDAAYWKKDADSYTSTLIIRGVIDELHNITYSAKANSADKDITTPVVFFLIHVWGISQVGPLSFRIPSIPFYSILLSHSSSSILHPRTCVTPFENKRSA